MKLVLDRKEILLVLPSHPIQLQLLRPSHHALLHGHKNASDAGGELLTLLRNFMAKMDQPSTPVTTPAGSVAHLECYFGIRMFEAFLLLKNFVKHGLGGVSGPAYWKKVRKRRLR